jgi:hypothetical protein
MGRFFLKKMNRKDVVEPLQSMIGGMIEIKLAAAALGLKTPRT